MRTDRIHIVSIDRHSRWYLKDTLDRKSMVHFRAIVGLKCLPRPATLAVGNLLGSIRPGRIFIASLYRSHGSLKNSCCAGADGRGYLARTYYAEIEYILPGAVMQPVWDSVKKKDGTVDFGLSYHRAFYSKDYDNYHDIYLQRRGRIQQTLFFSSCEAKCRLQVSPRHRSLRHNRGPPPATACP